MNEHPVSPERHLEELLGVSFDDRELFDLSLTHRSYAFESGGVCTNERMEFLGDAVLGVVVTDFIYRQFPDESEGKLAKVRAAAVNTESLARVARKLELGHAVRLGRGEEQSGGRDKDSILADSLEAVIGALYLDKGMQVAFEVVKCLFSDLLRELATTDESLDFKTSLQELTASQIGTLPVYQLSETGPDHEKWFTAVVIVEGLELGTGEGKSKKVAEQAAANEAYGVLRKKLNGSNGPDADAGGLTR